MFLCFAKNSSGLASGIFSTISSPALKGVLMTIFTISSASEIDPSFEGWTCMPANFEGGGAPWEPRLSLPEDLSS
jgi:hypothetical protein